jgi:hypothetical protein
VDACGFHAIALTRDPEELVADADYGRIKRDILHCVREEAAKSLALELV